MDNLKALKRVRKEGTLIVTVYPTPDMVGCVRDAVNMSIELGADVVSITPPILKAANAEFQDYRQDIRDMHKAELTGIEEMTTPSCLVVCNYHWFDVIEGQKKPTTCEGTDFYTLLGPDGKVYPCFRHWLHEEYSYGDLNEQSFKTIWESQHKRDVQARLMAEGPDDGTYCRNCVHARLGEYLKIVKYPSRFCGAV
jgi:hypothetical protein